MPKGTALIVVNETYIRHILDFTLRMAGFDVLPSRVADNVVARVENDRPHLLIIEGELRPVRGYEVSGLLKQDPSTHEVKIIILADPQKASEEDVSFASADLLVPIRFSPQTLVQQLDELVGAAR